MRLYEIFYYLVDSMEYNKLYRYETVIINLASFRSKRRLVYKPRLHVLKEML